MACIEGRREVAQFLLTHGARVNTADTTGRSPLDLGAQHGDPGLIQLLLEHGASMEQGDSQGVRPLDRAIAHTHAGAVQVFLRKGAKLGPATWREAGGKPDIM